MELDEAKSYALGALFTLALYSDEVGFRDPRAFDNMLMLLLLQCSHFEASQLRAHRRWP